VAKITVEGTRAEEGIGFADDDGAPLDAIGFRAAVVAALDWSKRQYATIEARREAGVAGKGLTVRTAVEEYIAARGRVSAAAQKSSQGRLALHVLSDEKFADLPLARLRASSLLAWRDRLPVRGKGPAPVPSPGTRYKPMAPASLNRILSDLRAALNASTETHRRELPPHLPAEIRIGTRAIPLTDQARRQLLTDAQVKSAVAAAFEQDDDGHFGRLVMLAAATGARYSQLAALRVSSVQVAQSRILVPGAKKGRSRSVRPPVPVPLSPDVLARLGPALDGREHDAPLLLRWAYKSASKFRWTRHELRPLGAADGIERQWAAVVKRAGLPAGTVMYALRHSSIVRGLRAGLPVRLVASLHDTSSEMIEAHYSAFIIDVTEDLARRAMLSVA
jgi:integrase